MHNGSRKTGYLSISNLTTTLKDKCGRGGQFAVGGTALPKQKLRYVLKPGAVIFRLSHKKLMPIKHTLSLFYFYVDLLVKQQETSITNEQ